MTDRSSRHANQPTYRRELSRDGQEVELYQPRLRTRPEIDRYHKTSARDRLDLVARRYFGDPHRFWMVADGNPEIDLELLLTPGRTLEIPKDA